jgi:hypothetical protein
MDLGSVPVDRNGSRSWQEGRDGLIVAVGGDGVGEVGEEMLLLLATGRRHGQDLGHERVPVGTVRPETALVP